MASSEPAFLQEAGALLERGTGWAGLPLDALAFVLARVAATGRWLVVVDEEDAAERLTRAVRFFHPTPGRVEVLPADDTRPYDGFPAAHRVVWRRFRALHRVEAGGPVLVVASAAALLRRLPDRDSRRRGTRVLEVGGVVDRDDLVGWLSDAGYLAAARVEDPGCFAIRGDVVDVWPVTAPRPLRVDLFDEEVESLRRFDPSTQRAGRDVERALVLPAREERVDEAAQGRARVELGRLVASQGRGVQLRRRVVADLRAGIRFSAIGDWLPALVPTAAPLDLLAGLRAMVVSPEDVRAALLAFEERAGQRWEALDEDERPLVPPEERYASAEAVIEGLAEAHRVYDIAPPEVAADLGARTPDGFAVRGSDFAPVVARLRDLAQSCRVGLVVDSGRRATNLLELLANHGVAPAPVASPWDLAPDRIGLLVGDLPRGFVAEDSGWAFIPASTLFGARRRTSRKAERIHALFESSVASVAELKEDDLVVHRVHGIGRYKGLVRLPVGLVEQDFARLEYRGGDLMYLPATHLGQLSRYASAHAEVRVKLDRLGGQTWTARKGRVKDSLLAMAAELLDLYARRDLATRPPLPPPGDLSRAFEARFPWVETEDQAAAIDAVHEDLSGDHPMDRLLCGDVGFGKTEVAMRAAARVVEAGRQVAVLCPTTVLATQHLQTFRERFAELPVRVEMLSRFVEPTRAREIGTALRSGEVHIVVGTTRLLGRGIRYRDLGLVVVDEEHRFGVKQKEKLKRLRTSVDYLAMSATPIPRTLELAISGIRPMSVMATPPEARLAVRTVVSRLTRARVRDALLLELERGGQAFFVHNRVETIEHMAERLREWVPEARFAVAHGQLDDERLERVMVDFVARRYDVLVTSAIIESGVDLPNVNTMLVNRADRFGLAQLYQLRGRVGRSDRRATCLLLAPEDLSREARKRLQVIVENAQLGAGFRVASADLELRGAGNLLGEAQSGNIDAVGYEVWLELLSQAVDEVRGDLAAERVDPEVEVSVPAFIPDKLVPDMTERLTWYRRISGAPSPEAVDGVLEELEGWVGALPVETANLGGLVQARLYCKELGIGRCVWLKVRVELALHPSSPLDQAKVRAHVEANPKRFALVERHGEPLLMVRFLPQEAERPLRFLRWVFTQLRPLRKERPVQKRRRRREGTPLA